MINGERTDDIFKEDRRLSKAAAIAWLQERMVKASVGELEELLTKLVTDAARQPKQDRLWILGAIQSHAVKSDAEISAMLGLPEKLISALRNGGNPDILITKGLWQTVQNHRRAVIQAHASTHSQEEIGRMLGVTKERVRQMWRELERRQSRM